MHIHCYMIMCPWYGSDRAYGLDLAYRTPGAATFRRGDVSNCARRTAAGR